jgi:hypothetical protein
MYSWKYQHRTCFKIWNGAVDNKKHIRYLHNKMEITEKDYHQKGNAVKKNARKI